MSLQSVSRAIASTLTTASGVKNYLAKPLDLIPQWASFFGKKLPSFFYRMGSDMTRNKLFLNAVDFFPRAISYFYRPFAMDRSYVTVVNWSNPGANTTANMVFRDEDKFLNRWTIRAGLVFSLTETLRYLNDVGVTNLKDNEVLPWTATVSGLALSGFSLKSDYNFYKHQKTAPLHAATAEIVSLGLKTAVNLSALAMVILYAPGWARNLRFEKLVAGTALTVSTIASGIWERSVLRPSA